MVESEVMSETGPETINDTQARSQGAANDQEAGGPEGGARAEKQSAEPKEKSMPSPAEQIQKLTDEKRELNDRMLRIAADFENFKRRVRKEMEDAGVRNTESFLRDFLPILDNLDRAVTAASQKGESADPMAVALLDGVRLVQKQFLAALDKFQVKPLDAQGKAFDPQYHEAVQQIESDTLAPGTVATVFQRGYVVGSRLLRPAMVAVVKGRARSNDSEPVEKDGRDEDDGHDGDSGYHGSNGAAAPGGDA
jgi:molecular chaperone GrpE